MPSRPGPEKKEVDFPRRGEIHLVGFDPTVGHEIQKTRPAAVIQNDISNQDSPVMIVAAISSRFSDPPFPREVMIEPKESGLPQRSAVILTRSGPRTGYGSGKSWAGSPRRAWSGWTKRSRLAWGWRGYERASSIPDRSRLANRSVPKRTVRGGASQIGYCQSRAVSGLPVSRTFISVRTLSPPSYSQ
jgi:mRNA-degrading endonuclease toxin of MazEF toxin-antitoxin module